MPEDDARKFLRIPIWKWSLLSSVVTVLGVFGGLIGVVQYTQTVEAKRAEKTLELIDKWTKEGYRAGFLRLRDRTFDVLQNQSGPDSEKVAPNAGPNLRAYIVREVLGMDGAGDDFEKVVYYFNYLGLCVEADVCSDKAAQVFFDDTLLDFLSFYEGEVDERRLQMPDYAEGLKSLEKRFACQSFLCW